MNKPVKKSSVRAWLQHYLPGLVIYFLATLITNARSLADTGDYVDSILAYDEKYYYLFWEIGHVLWRPLGWLVLHSAFPVTNLFVGPDPRSNASLALITVAWIAGLVSVLTLTAILREFCQNSWIVNFTLVGFILSHGFLNYSQAGCSYIPGLSLILLALYMLIKNRNQPELWLRTGILAGLGLGGAICFWLTNIVAIPVVLAVPLLLSSGSQAEKVKLAICTAFAGGLTTAVIYGVILVGGLGIYTPSGFMKWMAPSTVGTAQDKSISRTAFGFPRSFIFMGTDGFLFKRYLSKDPYTPVSTLDLLGLTTAKLALFYLFLASLLITLWRTLDGKKILALLLLNIAPVMTLALYWQGGDIERYLALYPLMFISLGYALCSDRALKPLKYVCVAFVIAAAVTNVWAMSKYTLNRQQEAVAPRLRDLQPTLNPQSRVFTINLQDPVYIFWKTFPFHPINEPRNLTVDALMATGAVEAPQWQQEFSRKTLDVWNRGAEVWLSRRVLSDRPKAEWNWVEGDDKRLSWKNIHDFFSKIEFGQSSGGEDGFVLILPSEANKGYLHSIATPAERRPETH